MSLIRRSLGIAVLFILAFSILPVSLSPSGGLEVDGLCASTDCQRKAGYYCFNPDTGEVMWGYKAVVG